MRNILDRVLVAGLALPGMIVLWLVLAQAAQARPGDVQRGNGGGPGALVFDMVSLPMPVANGNLALVYRTGAVTSPGADSGSWAYSVRIVDNRGFAGPEGPDIGGFTIPNRADLPNFHVSADGLAATDGDLLLPFTYGGTSDASSMALGGVMRWEPSGRWDTPGSLDLSFGIGGIVKLSDACCLNAASSVRRVVSLVEQPDGKLLVLERTEQGARSVLRLLADGRVDTNYGTDGRTAVDPLSDLAMFQLRADGALVVADNSGRIRLIDAQGRITVEGRAPIKVVSGVLLPDGATLLVGSSADGSGGLWIARLGNGLEPDTSLGGGTGAMRIAFEQQATGRTDVAAVPSHASVAPGTSGQVLIALHLESTNFAATDPLAYRCGGALRLTAAGTPQVDSSFGRQGFSCVTRRGLDRGRLLAKADGGALLYSNGEGLLLMSGTDTPGPGYLSIQGAGYSESSESAGTLSFKVGRSAGSSGAVSVPWSVSSAGDGWDVGMATPGKDYEAGSDYSDYVYRGVLEWSDGDATDRTITVNLLDDSLYEGDESFTIQLAAHLAVGALVSQSRETVVIRDNDSSTGGAVPSPSATPSAPAALTPEGGGGPLGFWSLLSLLVLLAIARPEVRDLEPLRACGH